MIDLSGIQSFGIFGIIAGIIIIICSVYLTMRKVWKKLEEDKHKANKALLEQAKQESDIRIHELESRLNALESDLSNLKNDLAKDLSHIKEIHTNELQALGEKISALRDELRQQNAGVLDLLSKIIDKS